MRERAAEDPTRRLRGAGVFRDPKVFLRDGQIVRAEIEGIGAIENRVTFLAEKS